MPAGNDIVAWQHPRCVGKWQHRRFLEKTCTPKEIQQLETAPNPDLLLWACWAAKEAAYKLSCFLGNRNGFIARRFETFFDGGEIPIQHNLNSLPGALQGYSLHTASLTGWVHGGTDKYFAAINVAPGYIHALATTAEAELQQVAWGIQQNNGEENDNGAVRRFAVNSLNQFSGNRFHTIEKDKDGIPFLLDNENANPYISLSHDHGYLAFAFGR